MMLLLGHPGLGAQNADIYNMKVEKPMPPDGVHPATGALPFGTLKSSKFGQFLGTLYVASWSRKKVVLNRSWAVQDEFQDRFQPSWGPKGSQRKARGSNIELERRLELEVAKTQNL